MKRFIPLLTRLITLIIGLAIASSLWAAPKKKLWPRWQKHQASSTAQINYQPYRNFLEHNVFLSNEGFNQVHYSKVSAKDKAMLDNFIRYLSKLPIDKYNKNEQLAYWINLYNALTIKLILDKWPLTSIIKLNLSPGWFSFGPWDAKLISVEGVPLTLNDIEHRIIRPIWNDSRTHYALNCASYSCPQIQLKPFEGKAIELMLNRAASEYVNSSRGVSIKPKALQLSSIYQWYGGDFGSTKGDILQRIAAYAKPELRQALLANTKVIKYDYNWQLNGD